MAEEYAHTLIAKQKDFVPSASQVELFLSAMVSQNVLPGIPTITLRIPTGKFRKFPFTLPTDAFTGKEFKVEQKDHREIQNLGEIAKAVESLKDYEVELAAFGRPTMAPIPIEFAGTVSS